MINYKENYNKWLEDNFFDEETREELSNLIDEKEIEDRFHLGTFQISDLTYNTLGGAIGGVIYYLGYCRKGKRKNKIRNRG